MSGALLSNSRAAARRVEKSFDPLFFQVVEDVWGPLVVAKEPVSKVPNIGEGIPDLAGGKTSVVA